MASGLWALFRGSETPSPVLPLSWSSCETAAEMMSKYRLTHGSGIRQRRAGLQALGRVPPLFLAGPHAKDWAQVCAVS
eukprot:2814482-Rhodomonas_salina.3